MMQLASSREHSLQSCWLLIGSDSQFAAVGIRDRAHQFVIGLAALERSQVIQLPQRLLRSILSRIRAELGDDDALSGRLQGQRG